MKTSELGMNYDFNVNKLEELVDFRFKEFKELENDEMKLKLVGVFGINFEKGFVPRYLFDVELKSRNERIGFVLLRVAITDDLLRRGGHIGYGIDAKHRGHSYASKAILMLKPFIKTAIGSRILVTCDEDNIASRRTIEKVGGILLRIEKQIEVPEENCKKDCCYYQVIFE